MTRPTRVPDAIREQSQHQRLGLFLILVDDYDLQMVCCFDASNEDEDGNIPEGFIGYVGPDGAGLTEADQRIVSITCT